MLNRLRLVIVFFILAYITLTVRLFYWQVVKGKILSIQARGQYEAGETINAQRGDIFDTKGGWLAASGEAYIVYASIPDLELPKKKVAEDLALFFVEDSSNKGELLAEIDRIYSLINREGAIWVPLKQKVDPSVKKKIEELSLAGIGFDLQEKRVYPESSSSAHLLGFVGKDESGNDTGYFGLEGYWDLALSGKPGFLNREQDAQGLPILLGLTNEVTAIEGASLITNIDKGIQLNIEDRLKEGIEKYGAKGGVVIVLQPKTGKLMALSAYPSYDPSSYWKYSNEFFINPAISLSFEPGSVFKVLVMASALDAEVLKPDTECDICAGAVRIDKYTIETWNQVYHPDATMTDVIVNSDNVGMVYVSQKLGADKLYDYLSAFGIGEKSGIDLQGESSPKLREKGTWSVVDLATAGFGQGIAVTPIQLTRAVAAIANHGKLVAPKVVGKIKVNEWEEDIKTEEVRRVISEKAASQITQMMVEAARNGEAKWTHLQGFKVAGKTGTAQIPIAGHYDAEKTIASFIGFAPYDDPEFVMLVTLQEPQTSQWASETAAPLWYSIARDLFVRFGIQPEK